MHLKLRQPPPPLLLTGVAVLVAAGIWISHWARLSWDMHVPIVFLGAVVVVALAGCLLRRNIIPIIISGLGIGAMLDTLQWHGFDSETCAGEGIHEAIIIDEPHHRAKSSVMKVRLAGKGLSPVMLTTLRDTTLCRGRHILFKAQLEKVRPAWRHYFHHDTWLFHQGVYWRAFAPRHVLVPEASFTPPFSDRLKARLRSTHLSSDTQAVVEAMVLGGKSRLSSQLREIYSVAGGSHLLALSGLHLGIIVGILMLVLGRNLRLRFLRLAVALPLIWGYVWLTGSPPSLVRSATMFSLWMTAHSLGRNLAGLDSLTLAVLMILAVKPFWLFDTGFQLSVISLAAITTCRIKIGTRSPVLKYLVGILFVGLTATVATAPLVASTFHRLPLSGWVMGIVYIPVTTAVVPLSFLLIAWPSQWLATVVDIVLQSQLWIMEHTGCTIDGLYPSMVTVALALAFLLLLVYRQYLAMSFVAVTLLLSMACDRVIPMAPDVCFEGSRAIVVQSRGTIHYLPCADTTFYRDGLYACGPISLLRVDDRKWMYASRPVPCVVGYLWICRGYNGHIAPLLNVVTPGKVVLDPSLSRFYRERFFAECDSLGLETITPFQRQQ